MTCRTRWTQRSYQASILLLAIVFLVYLALALFGSGIWFILGTAGSVVFGLAVVSGLGWRRWMRRTPVAATLTEAGVTVGRPLCS